MHERRARKIAGLIAEQPRTAHEIAQAIWGNVAVTQAFLTLSEVLGHVDLLIERGEVVEDEDDGVVQFTPRSGRSRGHPRRAARLGGACCRPPRARSTCRTRSCSWSAARCSGCCRRAAGGRRSTRTWCCVHLPAAAAVLGRVLRQPARPARRPAADLAAVDRARAGDDGRRRVGRARADRRAVVAGGVRARARSSARPTRSPATAIARRLGVPRRLVSVLEGEALVNDATALVAYRIAITAATGAVAFSLLDAGWEFLWKAAGGIAVGLVVGWVIAAGPQAARRPADGEHDRPAERLRRLRARRAPARLGRARRGHGRLLRRLAGAEDRLARDPAAGLRHVGAAAVPAQRVPVRADRAAAARWSSTGSTGRRWSTLLGYAAAVSAAVVLTRLRVAAHDRVRRSARSTARESLRARRSTLAGRHRRRLGGHARRGLAGRGARAPAGLPAARPDDLPDVRGDLRHARAAGADAAAADPLARRASTTAPRRSTRSSRRGCSRPRPRWRGSRSSRTRSGRATTRSSACAARTSTASGGWRRARARSRTTASRTARSPTRRSCARCWRRSAREIVRLRNEGTISNEVMHRIERELDLEDERLEI